MPRPCPRRLQAAQPCRGTWSFISSSPSVAMLPEGFFRGGLERRRTRLTLSRITWVHMEGHTQTLCVDTPVYREPLPAPLLTQGQWDSPSARHPPCPQVTEECWGTPSPRTAFLWEPLGVPQFGGCYSPLGWPHILSPPQEACLCTHC